MFHHIFSFSHIIWFCQMEYDDDLSDSTTSSYHSSSAETQLSPPTSSKRSQRKNQGLSSALLNQLLNDIEQSGGLWNASLKRVCGSNQRAYGVSGSYLQRQVQNKISRLKKLTPTSYRLLLKEFNVRQSIDSKNPSLASLPTPNKMPSTPRRVFDEPPKMTSRNVSKYIEDIADRGYVGKC